MKDFIKNKAENICMLLSERGEMPLRKIGEHTHCKDSVIFMCIGWLVKEERVGIEAKEGVLYFKLRENITEIYY